MFLNSNGPQVVLEAIALEDKVNAVPSSFVLVL